MEDEIIARQEQEIRTLRSQLESQGRNESGNNQA